MTAKEAIEILTECHDKGFRYTFYTLNQYLDAMDKAIEALQKEVKVEESTEWFKEALESGYFENVREPTLKECNNDAIIRKDALDEIREYLIEYEGLDENGLHNEKWCAMREAEMVLKDLPPVNLCEDVISREGVIQTINYYWLLEDASESLLVDMINELPPVQPVRPKGHWIELIMHRGMENYKCSVCNRESYVPVCMEEPLYSFCPVCGAKMEDCNN